MADAAAGASTSAPAAAAAPPPPALRWSWDAYPANRLDGSRIIVPLGCLYTPLAEGTAVDLGYQPLRCPCGAVLNPYCSIDFRSKTWGCPMCSARSPFPPHYHGIAEHSLPAELGYHTVDYVLRSGMPSPVFVFVVDTCVDTDVELENLKDCVKLALSRIPEYAVVSLITFGTTVQLHELNSDTPRSMVLRGAAEVTPAQMKSFVRNPAKYVGAMQDVEFAVTSIIEDLTIDDWPVPKAHRPMRCTGAAVSAAASLLELLAPQSTGSVVSFISGACTEGPGQVVATSKDQMIRIHSDIQGRTPQAAMFEPAVAFYDGVMRRMVAKGHPLHIVAACLDQWGAAEMKCLVQATGGMVIAADSWKRATIRQSINQLFRRNRDGVTLHCATNVTMDVVTSPTWKVMGTIGQCIGTGKRSPCVAESEIGYGGTSQWATSYLDRKSTLAIYFETTSPSQPATPAKAGAAAAAAKQPTYRYVQFVTKYLGTGTERLRVTTVRHLVQDPTNFTELGQYFDQEAAAVLVSRVAAHKTDHSAVVDVLRWLDRIVIKLVSRFGEYQRDQPQSLKLSQRFSNFPVFMFHLRRSAYLQVFNNSPDETAILRLLLQRADAADGITMIHPTLFSYTMSAAPQPVPLDISSSLPDNVLLLDTFFEVLIHHGTTIAAWRGQGFEENPGYAHFKAFLDAARADAKALVVDRYPAPRLLEVNQGDPDARILYNRINPSRTHNSQATGYGANPGELVYTDDASLQTFMEHLKRLAVQPN